MNDPHVAVLLYRVEHGESVSFKEAEPLVLDEPAFRLEVKDGQARFELKNHYATEEEAREAIEDYIRAWEFSACLESGPDSFRLEFHKAEIKDRNPTPGVVHFQFRTSMPRVTITPAVKKHSYPLPTSGIRINADVQTMFDRYMNHLRGREPLSSMAYFCLDLLLLRCGGDKKTTCREYQISRNVLEKIKQISSTKGGPSGARKGGGVSNVLTNEERRFLKETVERMIRRAAEKAHNPDADLPKITMSDLPPI